MRNSLRFIALYALFAGMLSCKPGPGPHRPYTIGLMTFGKTSKLTRQLAEQSCRNLLNDTVRRVNITWLPDSIPMQDAYYQPRNRYRAGVILKKRGRCAKSWGANLMHCSL